MFKFMLGVVVGALGTWLYTTEAARNQVQQWWSNAPEPVRQQVSSLSATTVSGAQRASDAADATPATRQLKERIGQVASSVRGTTGAASDSAASATRDEQGASAQATAEARREQERGA